MNALLKKLAEVVQSTKKDAEMAEGIYNDAAIKIVREWKHIPQKNSILLGTWYCNGSPTEHCAYDMTDEGRLGDDECIFCGAPNERK